MTLADDLLPESQVLLAGLTKLYRDASSRISVNFDHSMSDREIRLAATTLAMYLRHLINRHTRRACSVLDPTSLKLQAMCTYNGEEIALDSVNDEGWYYFNFVERLATGSEQISATCDPCKSKVDLLNQFDMMINSKVRAWQNEDSKSVKLEAPKKHATVKVRPVKKALNKKEDTKQQVELVDASIDKVLTKNKDNEKQAEPFGSLADKVPSKNESKDEVSSRKEGEKEQVEPKAPSLEWRVQLEVDEANEQERYLASEMSKEEEAAIGRRQIAKLGGDAVTRREKRAAAGGKENNEE